MRVRVTNRSAHDVELGEVQCLAKQLLDRMGRCGGVTIVVLTDEEMADYNRTFLHREYPTDVLAFPDHPSPFDCETYLGDILISADTALRQARERGHTFSAEVKILTIHGMLHLLGYDHTKDRGKMRSLEGRLQRELIENESRVSHHAGSVVPG